MSAHTPDPNWEVIKPSELHPSIRGWTPVCRCGKEQHLGECEDVKKLQKEHSEMFELLKRAIRPETSSLNDWMLIRKEGEQLIQKIEGKE